MNKIQYKQFYTLPYNVINSDIINNEYDEFSAPIPIDDFIENNIKAKTLLLWLQINKLKSYKNLDLYTFECELYNNCCMFKLEFKDEYIYPNDYIYSDYSDDEYIDKNPFYINNFIKSYKRKMNTFLLLKCNSKKEVIYCNNAKLYFELTKDKSKTFNEFLIEYNYYYNNKLIHIMSRRNNVIEYLGNIYEIIKL